MMKKKNLTLRYALTLMTYWGAYNGCFSFATTYMLKLGIPSGFVGTLVAASGLLSCFTMPVVASFVDRSKKSVLTRIMATLGLICVLLFAAQLLPGLPIYVAGILYTVGLWITDSIVPLLNAIYVKYSRSGYFIHYGISKGLGSASSAIGVLVSGFIMAKLGMSWTLVFYLSFYMLTLIFLLGYPKLGSNTQAPEAAPEEVELDPEEVEADSVKPETEKAEPEKTVQESCSIPAFFKKYKWYCVSLLGFMLFAMFLAMTESYMIAIMERLGGDSSHVGVALFISTLAGTPVVFCFTAIRRRVKDLSLLRIASVMYVVRAVLTFLAPSIVSIYMIQILHFCSYSFMAPTQVFYAGSKVNASDMVKGQAFISAAWALGCSIGNFIGGQLLDIGGITTIMLVGICMTIGGCIVMNLTIGKKDRSVTDTVDIQ